MLAAWEREADEFYAALTPPEASADEALVLRQALAGMLWSKQFFHYDVRLWLEGDPAGPPPPEARRRGRNHDWAHLNNMDVVSMPDKWEYPWYAAWDLAFHCVALAHVDPEFAKSQHFALIASALNEKGLWNEEDGFYYDVLQLGDGAVVPLRARSMVGLLPLAAVTTLGPETMASLPDFMLRLGWFTRNREEGRAVV